MWLRGRGALPPSQKLGSMQEVLCSVPTPHGVAIIEILHI